MATSQPHYDFTVAYRIYPKVSKVPPAFPTDKLRLSELCLRSFTRSYKGLRPKFIALLDNCPDSYEAMFRRYVDSKDLEILRLPAVGNAGTFALQIKLLNSQQDSPFVYFAEDDYYYRPGSFGRMLDLIQGTPDAQFITPYDHADYYSLELHTTPREIRCVNGQHWQTVGTTCMTFMTTKSVLARAAETLMTYSQGNTDVGMWSAITKFRLDDFATSKAPNAASTVPFVMGAWQHCFKQILLGERYKLWAPIPTIATHMENKFLSPGIDWAKVIEEDLAQDPI
jgi:hypothetical protein